MNGLIDYECEVYESGYEIVISDTQESDWFEPTSPINSGKYCYIRPIDPKSTKRTYNIMEHPGAYNEFMISLSRAIQKAEASPDFDWVSIMSNGIIQFANKYGLLTGGLQEETKIWFPHTVMMVMAVSALGAIKEGSKEKLDKLFINKMASLGRA